MPRPLRLLIVLGVGTLLGVLAVRVSLNDAPAAVAAQLSTTTSPTVPPTSTATQPSPTATPLPPPTTTSATTIPAKAWLTIQGVGDTNFDPLYIPDLAVFGYEFAFGGVYGLFRADDLTIVNLECSPSDLGTAVPKDFVFRCDPDALPIARDFGVDVANLANNHGQDYGADAMLDGRANVAAAGIAPVGVGADLAEATSPAVFEINGWRVAVLGMGGVVPSDSWLATEDRPGMASGDDVEQMTAAIRAADELADLVVVTIHWGWELETEPRSDDRAAAEAMVAAGADVVFGHHPHRLGAVEMIDGAAVFWTLGNFVWPRLSDIGATTAIGRVIVSPDGEIEACLIPAFIQTSGRPEITGTVPCIAGGD